MSHGSISCIIPKGCIYEATSFWADEASLQGGGRDDSECPRENINVTYMSEGGQWKTSCVSGPLSGLEP